ncbi:glycosyltransferase family 2 protein [Desulfovibrio aminophilus]|nr:glycosyltransferase family 2 protein [Desulfovibrio aminophilus]MCM0756472.1 glycosyltransferase family 2 protein [Desulfovibrio aminophilus]
MQPEMLSIVLPVFNEEDNLEPLLAEIRQAAPGFGRAWEVVLVDDASTDGSLGVIQRLASAHPEVRYLAFAQNRGQSAAFCAGFDAARGAIIATLDADGQNDPADIPKLLQLFDAGADMAIGWRLKRRDSFMKRIASKIGNGVRNRLTRETVRDTGCSLKIMRAEMARRLPRFKGMHRFLPTLMKMQGARVEEAPVNHRPRLKGVSKYGTWDRAVAGLYDLIGVRWLQKRSFLYSIREKSE